MVTHSSRHWKLWTTVIQKENLCPALKRNAMVSRTSTIKRACYYTWTLFFPCSSKLPGSYEQYLFTNCPRTQEKLPLAKEGWKVMDFSVAWSGRGNPQNQMKLWRKNKALHSCIFSCDRISQTAKLWNEHAWAKQHCKENEWTSSSKEEQIES